MPLFPAFLILLSGNPASELAEHIERFTRVFAVVEQEAADPVAPYSAFYAGAIPGMLRRLDPHSVFFDPDQFQQLEELQKSTRKGFGSVVSVLPGRVIVLQTLPGTPSARAGLEPGDEILAVNGIRLDLLSVDQLIGVLSESRQRTAQLDVRKPGNARLLQFEMTPADVAAESVDLAFLLPGAAGYVRIKSFEAETGAQLQQAIERLGGKSMKALVLDLRNNPGGLMGAALETAALFLPPKTVLASIRGRGTKTEEIKTPDDAGFYSFPIAVLVNERSASGSEIVAGALQDHDRAVIVGENSFGKGLVQSVFPLSTGAGLALTTAYYYTPSGRSIQKPLQGTQLDGTAHQPASNSYRTDSGQPLTGGGGIRPDRVVHAEPMTRLRMVLEATASFTSFATEIVRKVKPINEDFDVAPKLLDEFQGYLAARNIQPGVSEWSADREWIRRRLQQEVFNQSVGIDKGDQVEMRNDPAVIAALDSLKAPQL